MYWIGLIIEFGWLTNGVYNVIDTVIEYKNTRECYAIV